jgi:uncharacterized membrane protein
VKRVRPRIRPWLLAHLPAGILSRPAEWFLSILCVLSGQAILTGLGQSGSVERLLNAIAYYLWGAALVAGGAAMIAGLTSIRRAPDGEYIIRRKPVYLLGLRLLCSASVIFTIAVLAVNHWAGIVTAGITLAFAGMCGVRILVVGGRRK